MIGDHFFVRDGDHNRLPDEEIVRDATEGVRYLRAQDLKDGEITADDPVYITRRYYESIVRSHIRPGQLLFSIMGSVGNQAIVPDSFSDATANRAVGILEPKRPDPNLTRFLFLLFLTDLGAQLYERVKKGGLQKRANLADVEKLQFPLVPEPYRTRFVVGLDTARVARRQKLREAASLLGGLDVFALDVLGLELPTPGANRTTYAVRLAAMREGKKLYPDYFHPERLNAIRAVEQRFSTKQTVRLREIAHFVRDQKLIEAGDDYLGLANVQPNTGERVTSTEEDGKGVCFEYRKDDVLFARLRPYLNKVYRAESDGVCSTEFHVIRVHQDMDKHVLPGYLAAILRSSLVLAQTRHMMTGNTHPRLSNEDVVNLVIPVPSPQLQEKIAEEAIRCRAESRRLRAEAGELWEAAKQRFEAELLGPVPVEGAEG